VKVHEALSAVMADVQAVGKGGRADLGNGKGYSFRGVDDVVNAVGPALREHGCSLRPTRILDKQYHEFETRGGGISHRCVVEVEYTFTGPEADELTCSAPGEAADYGDKATPKAMAVAWRTAQIQLFCIPTDEPDPDLHNVERAPAVDESARVAQRTLLAEVKTAGPDLDADGAAKRAREVWDKFGQDPKRLTEMIAEVKA
jgi:hypothetical protein